MEQGTSGSRTIPLFPISWNENRKTKMFFECDRFYFCFFLSTSLLLCAPSHFSPHSLLPHFWVKLDKKKRFINFIHTYLQSVYIYWHQCRKFSFFCGLNDLILSYIMSRFWKIKSFLPSDLVHKHTTHRKKILPSFLPVNRPGKQGTQWVWSIFDKVGHKT